MIYDMSMIIIVLAMEDILNHPDTTMDIRISAVRETHNNGRLDLAIDALQALKQRTKISLDREKLEQLHLVRSLFVTCICNNLQM